MNNDDVWAFALEIYRRPGLADTCLELQDRYDARVTLILWLLWLQQQGVPVDPPRLEQAQRAVVELDEHLVQPLRLLRRQIKPWGRRDPAVERVRNKIKVAEQQAEEAVLRRLQEISESWPAEKKKPAAQNSGLALYLGRLGVPARGAEHIRRLMSEVS